jgi:methionyl aminopeptidase
MYRRTMSIETAEELAGMKRAGALVALTLKTLRQHVRPGVTTQELDDRAAEIFDRHGATSAPMTTYAFPGTICISVNDEVVHGVPGHRRLRDGDLVKLDVTPELDGFLADAAISIPVGRPAPGVAQLLRAADDCLRRAIAAAVAGAPLRAIGATTERTAGRHGASVFAELRGHGIGRGIHEEPSVPNVDVPSLRQRLNEGLVLAIEPMLTMGGRRLVTRPDGGTIATADGAVAAHVEHTIVVHKQRPLVLTA